MPPKNRRLSRVKRTGKRTDDNEGLESFFPSAVPDSQLEALRTLQAFMKGVFTSEAAAAHVAQSGNSTDSAVGAAAVAGRTSDTPAASLAASSTHHTQGSKSPEGSSGNAEGSLSSDSVIVESSKISKSLISKSVNIDQSSGKVSSVRFFANSEQRGATSLPADSQGSHSIAYVEVLLALLNSANEKGIRHAAFDVYRFIDSILQEKAPKADLKKSKRGPIGVTRPAPSSKAILSSIEKPKLLPQAVRKLMTKIMLLCTAQLPNVKSELNGVLETLNKALKKGKAESIAEYLCNIANHFLVEIQKKELTTFYSKGRISVSDSEKAKGAGAEKSSSRALVALDMLCSMCSSDISSEAGENEFIVKVAKFEKSLRVRSTGETEDEHVARYGLTVLIGERGEDTGKTADALLARLEGEDLEDRDLEQKKEILKGALGRIFSDPSIWSKVAGFMGGLLDYSRQIRFDLSKTTLEDVKKNFPTKYNVIKEETITAEGARKAVATVTRTSEKNLVEVLSRSIKIFSAAFPNLSGTLKGTASDIGALTEAGSRSRFNDLIDVFLRQEIIEKQGWTECIGTDKIKRELTPDSLSKAIKECESKYKLLQFKRKRSPSLEADSSQELTL